MTVHVLLRMIVKEFQQLRRDRKMIPAMIIGPLVQLMVFGFAANSDVTRIPTLLVDLDRTAASRDLADRFVGSGYFDIAGVEDSADRIEPWLVRGQAHIALVVPAGFARDLTARRSPRVQVIADGSDSSSAVIGLGYASKIVAGLGADIMRSRAALSATAPRGDDDARIRAGTVSLVPRVWYNPDLRSRWFYVPAILAMVLLLVTMIIPSMALVREKEIGTLEQLIVTPIRSWQMIAGKLAPFVVIGMVVMLLVTAVAVGFFRVPLQGSLPVLALLTAFFLSNTLGLGLLVSSMVRTQQQAMMLSTYGLMVPMIYLSGLMFPIENMPGIIRLATYVIPLRYYSIVVRGVFLKGAGLGDLWREAAFLAGFGLVVLTLAAIRLRKRLD